MAMRDRKARAKFHESGNGVVMEFGGKNSKGEFEPIHGSRHFKLTELPGVTEELVATLKNAAPMLLNAANHGVKQKVSDSFADPEATPKEAAEATWEQLVNGDWTAKGGGGTAVPTYIEALARLHLGLKSNAEPEERAKKIAEAQKRYDSYDEAKQKALRSHPKTKEMVATITEEKAKARKKALREAANKAEDIEFGEATETEEAAADAAE